MPGTGLGETLSRGWDVAAIEDVNVAGFASEMATADEVSFPVMNGTDVGEAWFRKGG